MKQLTLMEAKTNMVQKTPEVKRLSSFANAKKKMEDMAKKQLNLLVAK